MSHKTQFRQSLFPLLYFAVSSGYMLAIWWADGLNASQAVYGILCAAAFMAWIVARLQLGGAFSIRARAKHLVTDGLYAKIRHPVYVFSTLALFFLILFSGYTLLLVPFVLLCIVQLNRVRAEEDILDATFGKEYRAYKKHTWF